MYPLWASVPDENVHVLTRAMKDRALVGGGTLFATVAAAPVAGKREIKLPGRDPGQPKRTVKVELRHCEVVILRPQQERDLSLPPSVRLRVIEVRETDPPEGVEALHWRLLTTHDIADAKAAWEIVGWDELRWTIEQMFRVMKSQGLQLEDSQVSTAERLVKLAASGHQGGLRRHPTDAGPRRHRPDACVQRVQRSRDRHACGTPSNARRPDRAAAKPASA